MQRERKGKERWCGLEARVGDPTVHTPYLIHTVLEKSYQYNTYCWSKSDNKCPVRTVPLVHHTWASTDSKSTSSSIHSHRALH